MTITYLFKGILIGLSIAAPVGPIGILTIRKTLSEGRLAGFMTGLGAAFADGLYGVIAGCGLTAISMFMMAQEGWLRVFGGFFLLYLGYKTFRSIPATEPAVISRKGLWNNLFSTFVLTATNPATIFIFLSVFAAFGLGAGQTNGSFAATLVLGVFLGSALWWFTLSTLVGFLRHKVTSNVLLLVNRLSGILILSFGGYFVFLGLKQLLFS